MAATNPADVGLGRCDPLQENIGIMAIRAGRLFTGLLTMLIVPPLCSSIGCVRPKPVSPDAKPATRFTEGQPCANEGFVGASDGVVFMPVHGTVTFRDATGKIRPLSGARFWALWLVPEDLSDGTAGDEPKVLTSLYGASAFEPRRDDSFTIDSRGQFRATVSLSWDEHRFCKNGRLVIEDFVGKAHFIVRAKGCEDLRFDVVKGRTTYDLLATCGSR